MICKKYHSAGSCMLQQGVLRGQVALYVLVVNGLGGIFEIVQVVCHLLLRDQLLFV